MIEAARRTLEPLRVVGRAVRHWRNRSRDDFVDVLKLKLFVTRRCNLDCVHCGIGASNADGATDLDTDQIRLLWRHNPRLQLLSFSGGEPFLRDDMVEIGLAALRNIDGLLTLSVNTNGWFTDETVRYAEALLPELPSRATLMIACSSDGSLAAHSLVRRNRESHPRKEETLRALRAIAKKDPRLQVRHNVNVNRWNLDSITDYVEECEAKGEPCLVSAYSASKHYQHKREHRQELRTFLGVMKSKRDVWSRLQSSASGFFGNRYLTLAEGYYEEQPRKQPIPCFSLRASLIVEPDGMVRPCINFPVDLGLVQDNDFRLNLIANGPKADKLRATIREERCPICWTPNEAYSTMLCNLPNPTLWKDPIDAVRRLGAARR